MRMLCTYGDRSITGSLEKMDSSDLVRLSWQSRKICKMKYQNPKLEKGPKRRLRMQVVLKDNKTDT